MKPTILRDQATTPDGRPLTLHEHDGAFTIRVGGVELMSSRQHQSEERLAELACTAIARRPQARVLVGGLGMGFTLRRCLACLAADARVVVAELVPAVVRWNRDPAYGLGADALADPRVTVVERDVVELLRGESRGFDAVILDVDNGAEGLVAAGNDRLYSVHGLERLAIALRPGGVLAVWSTADDPAFVERMRRAGFAPTVERARVHAAGGPAASLFLGHLTAR